MDLIYAQETSPSDFRWRWSVVFPRTLTKKIMIFQTASTDEMWTIPEVGIVDRGKLLSSLKSDHWFAHPNIWDATLLSDGLEVTRWRPWQQGPGMYVGVRMDVPKFVEGVEVFSANGPWASSMDARVIDANGRSFCPLSAQWHAEQPLDLRKAATTELKREGIRYVLISEDAPDAQDFMKNPQAWGMHQLASTREAKLYEID